MTLIEKIEEALAPSLSLLGYSIVRITLGGKVRKTLQIMIERLDEEILTIDDCATASYQIGPLLDVENLIEGAYTLEVSSAGLNRPLTKEKDFVRFCGQPILVKTQLLINERRHFKGILSETNEEGIMLNADFGSVFIPYRDILSACLDIEDSLFDKK